jgi:hypothetical protein
MRGIGQSFRCTVQPVPSIRTILYTIVLDNLAAGVECPRYQSDKQVGT